MKRWRMGLLAAALLGLWGCSTGSGDLPQDKQAYAGQWRAPGVDLMIQADGQVRYARQKAGGNTTVSAPILEFDGDSFKVGAFIFSTTFEVQAPPHLSDGAWRMTVDGVELTRVDDRLEAPAAPVTPAPPAIPTTPAP